jgi:hypothetical protein
MAYTKVKKHRRKGKVVKTHKRKVKRKKYKKRAFFSVDPDPTWEEQLEEHKRRRELELNSPMFADPEEIELLTFEQIADRDTRATERVLAGEDID